MNTPNNVFRKNYKYDILNHLYFTPKFDILGTALGCSRQYFF